MRRGHLIRTVAAASVGGVLSLGIVQAAGASAPGAPAPWGPIACAGASTLIDLYDGLAHATGDTNRKGDYLIKAGYWIDQYVAHGCDGPWPSPS